ncbi:DUF5719 family protein [Varibaculum cambriense]|uniref:DUF5719 family protein n=1 Tax=Varibaculum cambriense TaxID=184870 RepID=UPI00290F8827|nr:DUF5719 family protein [Varibaculum cambriense]MDU5542617.1 DUF5719 family protein [Varibaculum cambriense]
MKKPAYKSWLSLFSALAILLAAVALALVIPKTLLATSSPKNSGREVAVPAGIQQVVCPGLPGEGATAWVEGISEAGSAPLTDASGNALAKESAHSVGKSGLTLKVKPVAGKNAAALGYVSSSGKEGENGFFAGVCAAPTNRAYFLTPGTTTGNASTLHLVNPSGAPLTARIQIWTEQGPLATKVTQKIPARASSSLVLDGQAPGYNRLGVLVEAEGKGVRSWVSSTLATGAQKAGAVHSPALATPSHEVLIPAAKITGKSSLRVLNPSREVATLQVSLLDTSGETPVSAPKKLQVSTGAVFDIPLGGVKDGLAAVKVKSDQPVVAAVFAQEIFAAHNTLAVYPSVPTNTSGAALSNQQATHLAFDSAKEQKIVLSSAGKTKEVAVKPGALTLVKIPEGVWQWQSETALHAGQLVGDPAGTFRTIGVGKAVREIAAITVKTNP